MNSRKVIKKRNKYLLFDLFHFIGERPGKSKFVPRFSNELLRLLNVFVSVLYRTIHNLKDSDSLDLGSVDQGIT